MRLCLLGVVIATQGVLATGCMSVRLYQPHRGLHRPVVVPKGDATFAGMRILVRCYAHEDHHPPDEAAEACSKIANEFTQAGAETEWVVPSGLGYVEPKVFDGQPPDLTIALENKIEHDYSNPFTMVACVFSASLIPTVDEVTVAQRVMILGRDGSVLQEDVLRARFVTYFGFGVWSLNYLLDWFVRTKADALSGDAPKANFSRDFYGQIRQMAYNAKVRSEILGLTNAPAKKPRSATPAAGENAAPIRAPDALPDDDQAGVTGGVPGGAGPEPAAPPPPPPADPADPVDPNTLPGLDPADG